MQTILGSSGVIGTELAKNLTQYTDEIRLVSRNPKKVNPGDQLFKADLTKREEVIKALENTDIAYLTVGLEYKTKVWKEKWPLIMQNVIHACKVHNSKLVFFDNVYCYGKVSGWMTEKSPINPISNKGELRAGLVKMLMEEIEKGSLKALIARSADFYGPNTPLSFFNITVMENLKKGKTAQWMINPDLKHSMTHTADAGKATALLGNTGSAFGQVWHLPTDRNARTGREYIEIAAKIMDKEPKIMVLKKWFLSILGLFIPALKENMEMLYQVESEYLFDSSKFDQAFDFRTSTYEEGIKATADSYQK
jgi:nucleoside-diphosphate-sugar epimerase